MTCHEPSNDRHAFEQQLAALRPRAEHPPWERLMFEAGRAEGACVERSRGRRWAIAVACTGATIMLGLIWQTTVLRGELKMAVSERDGLRGQIAMWHSQRHSERHSERQSERQSEHDRVRVAGIGPDVDVDTDEDTEASADAEMDAVSDTPQREMEELASSLARHPAMRDSRDDGDWYQADRLVYVSLREHLLQGGGAPRNGSSDERARESVNTLGRPHGKRSGDRRGDQSGAQPGTQAWDDMQLPARQDRRTLEQQWFRAVNSGYGDAS